jgi:ribulose-5-phosphate 4-epimerase/fuculose-1-phosphate aldolase
MSMLRSETSCSGFAARSQSCMIICHETHWWCGRRAMCRRECLGGDLLVIKPSGVSYDELSADNMVVTDLDANLVEGDHAPSSDTAAHAYVYKHMPEVAGWCIPTRRTPRRGLLAGNRSLVC